MPQVLKVAHRGRWRKRWYRLRNIVLAVVGVFVLGLGLEVYRTLTAKPTMSVDYAAKLVELSESYQSSEGENAWPVISELGAEASSIEMTYFDEIEAQATRDYGSQGPFDDHLFPDLRRITEGEFNPAACRVELELLARLRQARIFSRLDQIVSMTRAVRPKHEGPEPLSAPNLGVRNILSMARQRIAAMRIAAHENDTREFVRAFEQAMALGRFASYQPSMWDWVVGAAIQMEALEEVGHDLAEGTGDPVLCRELLGVIDRQPLLLTLDIALEGERALMLDIIQDTHTDDSHGNGRLIPAELAAYEEWMFLFPDPLDVVPVWRYGRIGNLAWFVFPDRRETTRPTNEYFDRMIEFAAMPIGERRSSAFDEYESEWSRALPRNQIILRELFAGGASHAITEGERMLLELAGCRIMIALKAYQATHGRFPDGLERLVPEFLAEIPLDPITGESFAYRLAPDDDPHGRPYLLYSIGLDGQDNQGRMIEDGRPSGVISTHKSSDAISTYKWSESARGFDFVINRPRPSNEGR